MSNEIKHPPVSGISLGLAFIGGAGLTLMMVVAGFGVVAGESADTTLATLLFLAGAAALISAIVAWFAIVQPHKHFDDINIPLEEEHHHGDEDEHAIVPHDEHTPVQH